MIPFAAIGAAKIASAFEWPGQPPKIAHSPWGICTPIQYCTWFRCPTLVFIKNDMSIGSAVFAQRTVECPLLYSGPLRFSPQNCPFLLGDQVPHLTHGT